VIPAPGKHREEDFCLRTASGKNVRPYLKNTQVVDRLPSKCEALSSKLSTANKRKKKIAIKKNYVI
jgi:hypothetical protein